MDFMRIIKTVMPAVVVLIAGVFGIQFVYNNYMENGSTAVLSVEPAAGEEVVTESMTETTAGAEVTTEVTTETAVTADGETKVETDCATVTATEGEAAVDAEGKPVLSGTDCITTTSDTVGTEGEAAATTEAAPAADAAAPADAATEHLPVTEGDAAEAQKAE